MPKTNPQQKSTTEKILETLEKNAPVIQEKPIATNSPELTETAILLRERIYTELYKIDAHPKYNNILKNEKNVLVARQIFDYLLTKSEHEFLEFNLLHTSLRQLLNTKTISDYVRETIFFCYDKLIRLNYANLYRPGITPP